MEQIQNKILRFRRSRNQIEQLLEEFEKGNLSVAEFCAPRNISRKTFNKWQSRYRGKAKKEPQPGVFAKLKIATPAVNSEGVLFAEVHGIRLYQPVAASYLKDLASL